MKGRGPRAERGRGGCQARGLSAYWGGDCAGRGNSGGFPLHVAAIWDRGRPHLLLHFLNVAVTVGFENE